MVSDTRPRCLHGVVYPEDNCLSCLREEVDRLQNLLAGSVNSRPETSILNPKFNYVPSYKTNIRKTFDNVRESLKTKEVSFRLCRNCGHFSHLERRCFAPLPMWVEQLEIKRPFISEEKETIAEKCAMYNLGLSYEKPETASIEPLEEEEYLEGYIDEDNEYGV